MTTQFADAIDAYFRDQRHAGRINSPETVRSYRRVLELHAKDTECPVRSDRDDVKRTLARWEHPNTRAREHSILTSFYDWMLVEGLRGENPARQVRKPKMRKSSVYRLTRSEVQALIDACETVRERRVILLGVCTGARAGELLGFQGRHFQRTGFVWFSPDITKGKTERWVPILRELAPVIAEVRALRGDHYVIPGYPEPGWPHGSVDPRRRPAHSTLVRVVKTVARRARIKADIHPHLLRHAYGDHVARHAGLRVAQALMGHASVQTTASTYVGRPGLDELAAGVEGLSYGSDLEDRRVRFEAQMQATSGSVTKSHGDPLDMGGGEPLRSRLLA